MANRYPTWEMYWESLSEERIEAKREGRKPHPATVAKFDPDHPGKPTQAMAPKDAVTSAAVIRRMYKTVDPA